MKIMMSAFILAILAAMIPSVALAGPNGGEGHGPRCVAAPALQEGLDHSSMHAVRIQLRKAQADCAND